MSLEAAGALNPAVAIKVPCLVATEANIVLAGLQTIGGVTLAADNRVLVWQQLDQTTNGIYDVSSGVWTRSDDAVRSEDWARGTIVVVNAGAYAGYIFECLTPDPIVLPTSALVFTAGIAAPASRMINTTAPLMGGGSLAGDLTLSTSLGATSLAGNATGAPAPIGPIVLGATLGFSGTSLRTLAGSGDVTWPANSFATTLNTVNGNVGTFGSATQAAQVTVNGKGLTTAAANVTITPAIGNVTGVGAGFAAAAAVNVGTAGAFVVNGGQLGSPSSVGTLPAYTLGGAISGGGNQVNNVVVGAVSPLAGSFTSLAGSTSVIAGALTSSIIGASFPFVAHSAADRNFFVGPNFNLADGVSIGCINDANSTLKGVELRSSNLLLTTSGITFNTGAQAGAIDASQRWVIGPATTTLSGVRLLVTNNSGAAPNPGVATTQQVVGADASTASIGLFTFQTGTSQCAVNYFKARGTAAAPAAVSSGDRLGSNFAFGYATSGGAAYVTNAGAGFVMVATDNFTSTVAGTRLDLYATPVGSASSAAAASAGAGFSVGTTTDPGAGNLSVTGAVQLGSFTVATLPAGVTGRIVYCSNCRMFNGAGVQEGAGAGTGGNVSYNGTAWKIAGTNVTAIA